jgi:hypothetical protein
MSIPGKRRRSLSETGEVEGQHTESLTCHTSTTSTDNTATASATLTPLTAMDTSEVGQDEAKSLAGSPEEEGLKSPQKYSWQGWAELENDPVSSTSCTRSSIRSDTQ